jgi:hypothetical protein
MKRRILGLLTAALLAAACTFTTADVGPTATSLRTAHDGLAREFREIDTNAIPSVDEVSRECSGYTAPTEAEPSPPGNAQLDVFTLAFCQQWSGATSEQRTQMGREITLSGDLNAALSQLLAYVEALDLLVKSREQSDLQAQQLNARLEGLQGVATALGASTLVTEPVRRGFVAAATALNSYQLTRSALRASERAQHGLDLFALSVRNMLGECDVELGQRLEAIYHAEFASMPCDPALRSTFQEATEAISQRMQRGAVQRDDEAFRIYSVRNDSAMTELRRAYERRQHAGTDEARRQANADIDAALRDVGVMDRLRPRYEAVVAAEHAAQQWRQDRDKGRHDTAAAFVGAANQNKQLSDAIRRDRQLDLGPLGFLLRSLLGAV